MSALDGRIRSIAREEAAAVLGDAPPVKPETGGEVAELRAAVEELTARLDTLESAAAATATAPKRASRKTAESAE